jgi:two-component system response regulator AtoC
MADEGVAARRVSTADELTSELDSGAYDLVVAELELAGSELIQESGEASIPVVVLVPEAAMRDGMAAVRGGAADFLRKPVGREEIAYVLGKALRSVARESDEPPRSVLLRAPAGDSDPLRARLIGGSPALAELEQTLRRAAVGIATVLVRGESGSGKEVVARLVHELSPRAAGPFVKVHCGALPDNLLESELFGYEKGAFTGAAAKKPGRVELAEGGTLFLDEIGDITPATQVKLLRLLQDREYERLGGTETLKGDVRFVAATHQDLEAMVRAGTFREDLFYRLNVVTLWVPPLRARTEDIEALALHFCESVARANGRPSVSLDVGALELLKRQSWPGNVRQLHNFVERLVVLAAAPRISESDVTRELGRQSGAIGFAEASGLAPQISLESSVMDLALALRKAERRAIEKALKSASGNRNLAARLLGISRRSLYYKLGEHGLG